jgi:hypothetical protein
MDERCCWRPIAGRFPVAPGVPGRASGPTGGPATTSPAARRVEVGSYLTPDPFGLAPAPNPHVYVPNPLQQTDPRGLMSCDRGGARAD